MPPLEALMEALCASARKAGHIALDLRAEGVATETKADLSPVTRADRASEASILEALARIAPDIPVVAEEAFAAGRVPTTLGDRFFLVDPIDGTREFISGRDEFTVNIALVEGAYPVAGVVVVPALGETFEGSGLGAFRTGPDGHREAIRVRPAGAGLVALASRSNRTEQTDAFLSRVAPEAVVAMGSSLKFCRVAQGAADLYPCFGPTMEWDTAAGQAVVEAAGGSVVDPQDKRLSYRKGPDATKPDFRNPFFLARGGTSIGFNA